MSTYHAWWKEQKDLPDGKLPDNLMELLERNDPRFVDKLCKQIYADYKERFYYYYNNHHRQPDYSWLWNLYLHPSPLAKQGLKKLLSQYNYDDLRKMIQPRYYYYWYTSYKFTFIPFTSNSIRYVKAIYKLAELQQDKEIWPVLAYRFDAGRSNLYSKKTRHYLRRRTWRYLRRLGEQDSADYIHLATKVLLYYDSEDGQTGKYFDSQTNRWITGYTRLWLFNHILCHNSQRFTYPSSRYFQDQGLDSYPLELPEVREEAFPELWDRHPEQLFLLLTKAKANPVMQFAGRALRMGNPDYVNQLPIRLLHQMLESKYTARRAFAAGVLLDRLNPDQPDFNIWFPLMFSGSADVRAEAKRFVRKYSDRWQSEQIRKLILTCNQHLIETINNNSFVANDLIDLFEGPLKEKIASISSIELAEMFLRSPAEKLQKFSAYILSRLQFDHEPLKKESLLPFLLSPHLEVQDAAQKLLVKYDVRLKLDGSWIAEYIICSDGNSRLFIVSFLQARKLWLLPLLPELLDRLWSYLLCKDGSEEIQEFILESLFGDLFLGELSQTPLNKILALLEHDNTKYQEFAALLIRYTDLDPDEIAFQQLLSMAHNRVAMVRAEARRLIMKAEKRITADWMYNLIETDWNDTREWMFAYIRNLSSNDITPELIYGLLDTARNDVQQLARELVQKYESNLDLKQLMLRGSEHPHLRVQEYVLHLAEKIDWDETAIQHMKLFFRTVLLRVNQGRKAKKMALSLLLKLSEQKLSFAKICVPILSDAARTQGIGEFDTILTALTRIQTRYPELSSPIEILS